MEPFHLVITDKQGLIIQLFAETDTLLPLMDGPSYKAYNLIYPGCCTLNLRESAQQSVPQ
jgi:hypothetical protein